MRLLDRQRCLLSGVTLGQQIERTLNLTRIELLSDPSDALSLVQPFELFLVLNRLALLV